MARPCRMGLSTRPRGSPSICAGPAEIRVDTSGQRHCSAFWIVLSFAIPAILGGVLTGTWVGVLLGFFWGGLVRVFLVHHVTWSVNSICHLWGTRAYPEADESRNNLIFGILALGEGWHNNHHAFPTSARHGLRWWQIDVSYYVIRCLALVGLAWKIRLPSEAAFVSVGPPAVQ